MVYILFSYCTINNIILTWKIHDLANKTPFECINIVKYVVLHVQSYPGESTQRPFN